MPIDTNVPRCVALTTNCAFCTDPENVLRGIHCSSVVDLDSEVQVPNMLGGATDYFTSQVEDYGSEKKQADVGFLTEFSPGSDGDVEIASSVELPIITPTSLPTHSELYPLTDFGSCIDSGVCSVDAVIHGSTTTPLNLKEKSNSPNKCRKVGRATYATRSNYLTGDDSDDEDLTPVYPSVNLSETRRIRTRRHISASESEDQESVPVASLQRTQVRSTSSLANQVNTCIHAEQQEQRNVVDETLIEGDALQEDGLVEDDNLEKVRP
jgi:hypothetical protein